ncbi:hypothetical protein MRB53_005574 [Persea americana]|uniref:Uncharacterized protein n=1 Tax=Persea americana TaxID=3435 RepID=A0ACC2MDE1_PERAE|nr:hypothetical protein MRB53_005574 [Persea americana]
MGFSDCRLQQKQDGCWVEVLACQGMQGVVQEPGGWLGEEWRYWMGEDCCLLGVGDGARPRKDLRILVAEQGRTEEDPLPNASSLTAGWKLPFLISCCVFLPLPSL